MYIGGGAWTFTSNGDGINKTRLRYSPSVSTWNFENSAVTINNTPVLKQGDYGIGASTTSNIITGDISQLLNTGFYVVSSATTGNVPHVASDLIIHRRSSTVQTALAISSSTSQAPKTGVFFNGAWTWQELITTANISNYQSGLGVNQTWQNVKDSRALNTIYTNTTKKPIYVSVVVRVDSSNKKTCSLLVGDVVTSALTTTNYGQIGNCRSVTLSAIVPNGTTYTLSSPDFKPNIENWSELR